MRLALRLAVAASLLASYAAGASNMKFVGVGNNGALAGVYVGPYQGLVDGVPTPIICDDFNAVTYLGQTWTANVMTVADLNAGNINQVRWDSVEKYQQAAWLSLQLVTAPKASAGHIQFAIWKLFTPSAISGLSLSAGDNAAINMWLTMASMLYQNAAPEFGNVYIYTPTTNVGISPQEYLVVRTPEPGAIVVLSLTLMGVAGLCIFNRRTRASLRG